MTGDRASWPQLVDDSVVLPSPLRTDWCVLEPLAEWHTSADLEAWTSSIPHIQSTPGFAGRGWPVEVYTFEQNLADMRGHGADFAARRAFAYSVLDPDDHDVIGCVYLDPCRDVSRSEQFDVEIHSWVRASRAELDWPLAEAVRAWVAAEWPFRSVFFGGRDRLTGPQA